MAELTQTAVCVDPRPGSTFIRGRIYRVSYPFYRGDKWYVSAERFDGRVVDVFASRFQLDVAPQVDLQETDPWTTR